MLTSSETACAKSDSCFPPHFRERCLQIHTDYVMYLRSYPEPETHELMAHMGHRALFDGAPVDPAGFPVAKLYPWVRSSAQEWIDAGAPRLAGDLNHGTRMACEECDRLRVLHGEQWREAKARTGAGETRRSP